MTQNTSTSRYNSGKQPIAIIGIGCRFPGGANSPQAFWKLLRNGTDAITQVPPDRWNLGTLYDSDREKPGKTYTRWGGFVEQIDQFDAQFFGISPREAVRTDPQQRLLMEVAWEALEDGGQVPEHLAGTSTGVFIGISSGDYYDIQLSDRNLIDAYTNLGGAYSITANRLSYIFNVHGPSIAIDTACSSSLVAVHLACASIWNGECTLALAGGVNALLRPEITIGMSKASMLSPDGRCKSFDECANGYVRSEGAGIVVLKPLSQALADNDPIYAVIRGSGVNQDGRTNGITVPSGQAQETLMREVYQQVGISPEQIQYVEAHGTGTPVGDPIEANALGAVLSHNRPAGSYCAIGSVKSNIGHLEAAAGVAGLIKVALSLKHRQIPANLHFQTPNPKIPLEELQLRVPQTLEPWLSSNGLRLAGVNSFGFGGTNAHIVVAEAPLPSPLSKPLAPLTPQLWGEPDAQSPPELGDLGGEKDLCVHRSLSKEEGIARSLLLPLSARSEEALKALAVAYQEFLTAEDSSLSDICYTASLRRSHHNHRLALVAESKEELAEHLDAFIAGEPRRCMSSGRCQAHKPKLAFVFSGMGPQWWAMGRQLLEEEPVFRDMIEKCDRILRQYTSWSLWQELTASEETSRINETQIAQPAIFSVQVALAALWHSWGIHPDVIVGHSVGEVAASHVAGVLSLEDAVQVIFHRSRLQQQAAGQGRMLAVVGLSLEETERLLADYGERVSIAAINSPNSVTLGGDTDALEDIAQSLQQKQIFCRFPQLDVPYHTPKMDALTAELVESLQGINPQSATIPLFSTVTGQAVNGTEFNGSYWAKNVREPVLFASAIDGLIQDGYELFLEISAHPVLANSISDCLTHRGKSGIVLPSLRRKEPERAMMLGSFGKLYTLGYPVDWHRLYPEGGCFVRLPSYPWQRQRYWQESPASQQARLGQAGYSASLMLGQQVHPLLGCQLKSAQPTWNVEIDTSSLTYLNEHRLQGAVVYPGTAYVEMALAAAKETFGEGPYVLEDMEFENALFLPHGEPQTLQLILDRSQSTFEIYSQAKDGTQAWVRHVTGKLNRHQNGKVPPQVALDEYKSRCTNEISKTAHYRRYQKMGIEFGPSFQGIERLWSGQDEALSQLQVPAALVKDVEDYHLHPAFLDACIQPLIETVAVEDAHVLVKIDRVRVYGRPGLQLWSYARLTEQTATFVKGNIQLLDDSGSVLVEIQGLCMQSLKRARPVVAEKREDYLYEYQWKLKARPGQQLVGSCADYLLSPRQIAENIHSQAALLSEQHRRTLYYSDIEPQLESLVPAYILNAFQQLGWEPQLHQRIVAETLAEQLGVASQHRRLLGRMLEILHEDGVLSQVDDQWEVVKIPDVKDPQEIWNAILAQFPAYQAELILLGRCGQQLASVLREEVDPLELIFPKGSLTTEQLYQDAPSGRIYNLLVQNAIATALERLPKERTIRILEIGAGTGGTTTYVLPVLPTHRTHYIYTDVSKVFTTAAEQKFRNYPFVEYRLLDIEADAIAQGFEAHSFDLILASNVLHATRDLHHTLEYVKQLLTADGLLVLLELTNPPAWIDLVFGLLKGWWLFTDLDLRPSRPLLPARQWRDLLEEVGFTEVAGIGDTQETDKSLQTVILARGPHVQQDAPPVAAFLPQPEQSSSWLIFADNSGVGQQLAELLKTREETPILVSPGDDFKRFDADHFQVNPEQPEDIEQLLEAVSAAHPACRGIVHLWSLDTLPPEETTLSSLASAETLGCLSVLHLVQALTNVEWSNSPRLWLVTSGTQAVGSSFKSVCVAQSPLWGLGRVIANEHPNLQCTRVDLNSITIPEEIQSLFEELCIGDGEDELVLRGKGRYVHRLMRIQAADIIQNPSDVESEPKIQAKIPNRHPFRWEISTPGSLDNMTPVGFARSKPGAGEVEIQIDAAALNFKDVLAAMGMLSDEALAVGYSGRSLGAECAGTIVAVGEGVEGFEVGDEVVGFSPYALGTHTTTKSCLVVPKPAHLSFEEAATIPTAFLTAYYSLHHLARLGKGERILIHAAAGGVGLAAIQIAKAAGVEIFATAGTEEKREFLRAIGIQHVMDSRSLTFADEVLERTDGKGVDIVLNSLAGEAIPKSLSVLGAGGRFIELGKRDIYDNSKLGLRPFRNNLSFFAVDIDRLMRENPEFTGTLFREVMQCFADGSLYPLPHRVFPILEVVSAFRYMAGVKHIGKIVVSLQDPEVVVAPSSEENITFRADGTYLLTGGLGGFGLAVAQWLVEHGARYLVLMGRSGASSPTAKSTIEAMQEAGARVVVAKADVTAEQQVKSVLDDIRESMPPLRGIIHGAMVLDDAVLTQLNQERFHKAMAPKAIGAWNLHTQTLNAPLDFFVMFSSFNSVVGNPGQGNYAAANAFLEGLAYHRRALSLPALTVNWGVLADVGYVAQNTEVAEHLQRIGAKPLPVQQALKKLGELLLREAIQTGVADWDWQQWSQLHAAGALPRYSLVVGEIALKQDESEPPGDVLANPVPEGKPEELLYSSLVSRIREQVARVLAISPSKLDIEQPLADLGLDSLMAIELRNRLRSELGVELPVVNYLGNSSVAELVTQLGIQPIPAAAKSGLPNGGESTTATLESTMRSPYSPSGILRQAVPFGQSLQPPVSPQPPTFPKLEEELQEAIVGGHSDSSNFQNRSSFQVSQPLPPPSLVPLQPAGTKPPFFCVHPVSGVVFPYYELACQLGPDRPFYGLQSVGIEGEGQPLTRIEDMARHYIEAIRTVQPEGPYFLGGWSFGTCVAFEMAQQLQREEQTVAMLVLIDTPPPSTQKNANSFELFRFYITKAVPEIWPYVYDYFYLAIAAKNQPPITDKGERILNNFYLPLKAAEIVKVVARESRLMRLRQPTVRRILHIIQTNNQALINYTPQVYPGRITLFRTSDQIGIGKNRFDPSLGWNELAAQGVEIHQIPGAHLNLLRKPHVQIVAEKLKACLHQY